MYLFLLCENIFLFNCLIWSEIEYIVDVVRINLVLNINLVYNILWFLIDLYYFLSYYLII